MARTRSLKPGFFHDARLLKLPPLYRLLFEGLWCYADREGRLMYDPEQIKQDVLPNDDCSIVEGLRALSVGDKPFIVLYPESKVQYIQIRNFQKHQYPHFKEQASIIPAPVMPEACPVQAPDLPGASPAFNCLPVTVNLNPETDTPLPPSSVKQKNAADLNGHVSNRFEEFWQRYPNQVGKDAACREWCSVVTDSDAPAVFELLARYEASGQWHRGIYADPVNWLRKGHASHWADSPAVYKPPKSRAEEIFDAL